MSTTYEQAMDARTNGDLGGAAELLRRETATNPADERARFALGVVSIESGDAEQAVRTLHPLVVAHPDNAELLRFYAVALRGVRRYSDAIRVFGRANQLQPTPAVEEELRQTARLLEQQSAAGPGTSGQQSAALPGNNQQQPVSARGTTQQQPSRPVAPAAAAAPAEDEPDNLLASHLDSGRGGRAPEMRGNLRQVWHRRITSYRRFWLGAGLVILGGALKVLDIPKPVSGAERLTRVANHLDDLVPLAVLGFGALVLLATAVSARFTRYRVYEHRIDFERGVLSQRRRPVWLFDITGISLRRTPLLTLTGTAQIVVEYDAKEGKPSRESLIATGGARAMADYAETLQGEFLRERRAMKKLWI